MCVPPEQKSQILLLPLKFILTFRRVIEVCFTGDNCVCDAHLHHDSPLLQFIPRDEPSEASERFQCQGIH